jgi:hypothetical protein
MKHKYSILILIMTVILQTSFASAEDVVEDGFVPLFNGKDFTNWTVPEGDNGHWKIIDGVIDYDAQSEAKGDKYLWTESEFEDFVLKVDWKIKSTPSTYPIPIVLQDGSLLKDALGKPITLQQPNADSGVILRGALKSQVNMWCWPVGSGEVYGFRNDLTLDPEVRAGVTPRIKADKPVGEWNEFIIIMVKDHLTVILNQQMVIEDAPLPGVNPRGKLALQHHGGVNADGTFKPACAMMQFKNIKIRPLPGANKTVTQTVP